MSQIVPSQEQALSFYRAALSTARLLDQESEPRVFDADADAAWRAYGSDLPDVIRCDLILRNFAMLYPAAFAPGPVFGLSGWYNVLPVFSGEGAVVEVGEDVAPHVGALSGTRLVAVPGLLQHELLEVPALWLPPKGERRMGSQPPQPALS